MKKMLYLLIPFWALMLADSYAQPLLNEKKPMSRSAEEILGNSDCSAICYGGFRGKSQDIEPTIPGLKDYKNLLRRP